MVCLVLSFEAVQGFKGFAEVITGRVDKTFSVVPDAGQMIMSPWESLSYRVGVSVKVSSMRSTLRSTPDA